MKKCVNEIDVLNKRVIVRVDFNVPIKDGKILDTSKIDKALETINYLISQNSKIVLLSHLGKVKSEEDKLINTLKPVYEYLKTVIKSNVYFSEVTRSIDLENKVNNLNAGDVILIENTRWEDFPKKLESSNDPQLSLYWSSLGDVFVLDAFGSSHREHASTCGIARYIPSCYGFLVAKELKYLDEYVLHAEHPFTVFMGGAKIDDKLKVIKVLIDKCDYLLLGGGLANTCLKVMGYNIGGSICSTNEEVLKEVSQLLNNYKNKIILPVDVIVGSTYDNNYIDYKLLDLVTDNETIMDIGVKTINQYKEIIFNQTKTFFMNGTPGKYEDNRFANGTKELCELLKNANCKKIAGGGDAVGAINKLGYDSSFNYLSTGGGATLLYIANGSLAALDKIEKGM